MSLHTLSSISPLPFFFFVITNANPPPPSSSSSSSFSRNWVLETQRRRKRGKFGARFRAVYSAQSNPPRILKTNRRSSYDNDEDDDVVVGDCCEYDEEENDGGDAALPWLSDVSAVDEEFAEPANLDLDRQRSKLLVGNKKRQERQVRRKRVISSKSDGSKKLKQRSSADGYSVLSQQEIQLDEAWIPLLDYLRTFGLNDSHFIQMYERRKCVFRVNVCSARERLEYLLGVGVKHKNIRKILLRQPQILEYRVENNLKSHVAFLLDLGIPESRMGNIITHTPSLFSYSIKNSLEPTISYLVEEVGIKEKDLSKIIQLSPQILTQRIDITWNDRYVFLSEELGASIDSLAKMITKHPQFLHYSIQQGLLPKINFLRSIGMQDADILKVLTSHTQVLSLSLESNLRPKYLYLINELRTEVKSLTKYPTYLSLSLYQRIRPRHKFLESLKKAPRPFPLRSLLPSDECFCEQWAGTSTKEYLAFRQQLHLQDLAHKYGRQR